MTLEKSLLLNIIVILLFSTVFKYISIQTKATYPRVFNTLSSLYFSVLIIIVMSLSYSPIPGSQNDLRGSVIAIAGVFGGLYTLLFTALTGIAYRFFLGGQGAVAGSLMIIGTAFVILIIYIGIVRKKRTVPINQLLVLVVSITTIFTLVDILTSDYDLTSLYSKNMVFAGFIEITCIFLSFLLLNVDFRLSELKSSLSFSENMFHSLIENISDSLLILSSDFKSVAYVNQEFKNFWEVTQNDLKWNPFIWKKQLHDYEINILEKSIANIDQYEFKNQVAKLPPFHIKEKSNAGKWIQINYFPIRNSENIPEHYVFLSHDVSTEIYKQLNEEENLWKQSMDVAMLEKEVKAQTKELILAKEKAEEANALKTDFLANVSHELRTPMHSILSFTNFGISRFERVDKSKLLEYFKNIHTGASRLLNLINDLLDISKLESGKVDYEFKKYNLSEILNSIKMQVAELAKKKEQNVKINVDKSTKCTLDHAKFSQVIINLVSNAIKFSPPKKNIRIDCLDKTINFNGSDVPAINIKIIDEGIGIPEEEMGNIFNKFIQSSKTNTHSGGTGLGLAISYEIIKGHNGKIWAENNPSGEGSIFQILIPLEANDESNI
jgi:signal transduction histidine kinase